MMQADGPRFWVGTSGYNYAEWKGSFYREKFSSKKMLPYYAERLATVEINYTFYRMPTERLQRILTKHLDAQHGQIKSARVRHRTLEPVGRQCAMVLSMLAWVGHPSETAAAAAFQKGWDTLEIPSLSLLPLELCDFSRLDAALTELDGVAPTAKRTLLQASATCIEWDATVTVTESELLRAVAAALSCPMPPLVQIQSPHSAVQT